MKVNDLQEVIEQVKAKTSQYRGLYERNEEAVKQQLISEIFEALGWNWKNPEEIRPEDKTSQGRADYALLVRGKRIAFVEAKKLSIKILEDIKPLEQLGAYCYSKGVRYGILTNGVQWRIIKSYEEDKSIEERELFSVDLEAEPLEKIIVKLSLLSKENIEKLEDLARNLNQIEKSVGYLTKSGIPFEVLVEYLKPSNTSPGEDKIPQNAKPINELINVSWTKPVKLYVQEDGRWVLVPIEKQKWRYALLGLVSYLITRGFSPEILTIPKYIEDNPKDLLSKGKPKSYREINGLFVEVWLSANEILNIMKKLQKKTGINIALEIQKSK